MKVNSIVFYVLAAISLIIIALFCLGGSEEVIYNKEKFDEPVNTSMFLFWTYALVGLVCLATIFSAGSSFFINLQKNPQNAIKTAVVFLSLLVLLLVTYLIGDGSEMAILGYEGTDNKDPFWLKVTDMCLYSTYTLLFIGALAALLGGFFKKIIK